MSPDILIVRDGDGYRLLHGHLHLASILSMAGEVSVDVKGDGKVSIVKTRTGLQVTRDSQRLPLRRM
jgi:hypothetical protein